MRKLTIVCMAIGMVFMAGSLMAQTVTNNLNVTAHVAEACTISSVSDIGFGSYDPTSGTASDAAGSLTFRCVKGTGYLTYITGTRAMTGGGDTLNFALYTDAGRTASFPTATGGGSTTALSLDPITTNIYGRVPAAQDVGAAAYTATLVATVEY